MSYGDGSGLHMEDVVAVLKEANDRGVVLLNISQCLEGHVDRSGCQLPSRQVHRGVLRITATLHEHSVLVCFFGSNTVPIYYTAGTQSTIGSTITPNTLRRL